MLVSDEKDYKSLTYGEIVNVLNDITVEPYETILSKVVAIFWII